MRFSSDQRAKYNQKKANNRAASSKLLKHYLKNVLKGAPEIKVSSGDGKKSYGLFANRVNALLNTVKTIAEKPEDEPLSNEDLEILYKCFVGSGCQVVNYRKEYDDLIKADSSVFKKSEFRAANEILSKMETMRSIYLMNGNINKYSDSTLECHQVRENILEHFKTFDDYAKKWRAYRTGFDFSNLEGEVQGQREGADLAEKLYQEARQYWDREAAAEPDTINLKTGQAFLTSTLRDLENNRDNLGAIGREMKQVRKILDTMEENIRNHSLQITIAEEAFKEQDQLYTLYSAEAKGFEAAVESAIDQQEALYTQYPGIRNSLKKVVGYDKRMAAIAKEEKLLQGKDDHAKEVRSFIPLLLIGCDGSLKGENIKKYVKINIENLNRLTNTDQFNRNVNAAAELLDYYISEKHLSAGKIRELVGTGLAKHLNELSKEKESLKKDRIKQVHGASGVLDEAAFDKLSESIGRCEETIAFAKKNYAAGKELADAAAKEWTKRLAYLNQVKLSMVDRGEGEMLRKGMIMLLFAGRSNVMKDVVDPTVMEKYYMKEIPGLHFTGNSGEPRINLNACKSCMADMKSMAECIERAYPEKKKEADTAIAEYKKALAVIKVQMDEKLRIAMEKTKGERMQMKLQSDGLYNRIDDIIQLEEKQREMLEEQKLLREDVQECNRWKNEFEARLESDFTNEVLQSLLEKYKTLNDARKTYHYVNSEEYDKMIRPLCTILGFNEIPKIGDDLKNAVINPDVKVTRLDLANALRDMKLAAREYITAKGSRTWGSPQRVQRLSFANQLIRFVDDINPQFQYVEKFKEANNMILKDYRNTAEDFEALDNPVKWCQNNQEEERKQFGKMLNQLAGLSYERAFKPNKVVNAPQSAVPTI